MQTKHKSQTTSIVIFAGEKLNFSHPSTSGVLERSFDETEPVPVCMAMLSLRPWALPNQAVYTRWFCHVSTTWTIYMHWGKIFSRQLSIQPWSQWRHFFNSKLKDWQNLFRCKHSKHRLLLSDWIKYFSDTRVQYLQMTDNDLTPFQYAVEPLQYAIEYNFKTLLMTDPKEQTRRFVSYWRECEHRQCELCKIQKTD